MNLDEFLDAVFHKPRFGPRQSSSYKLGQSCAKSTSVAKTDMFNYELQWFFTSLMINIYSSVAFRINKWYKNSSWYTIVHFNLTSCLRIFDKKFVRSLTSELLGRIYQKLDDEVNAT